MSENLPVRAIVGEAYRFIGENWRLLLRAGWLATLLFTACSALIDITATQALQVLHVRPIDWQRSGLDQIMLMLLSLVAGLAILPLATGVHRLLLLGRQGRIGFHFHREEWRYFMCSWQIALLAIPVVLSCELILLPASLAENYLLMRMVPLQHGVLTPIVLSTTCWIVIAPALFLVLARVLLILPAAAIGVPFTMRDSRQLLRHRLLRFGAILLLAWLPLIALQLSLTTGLHFSAADATAPLPAIDLPPILEILVGGLYTASATMVTALALSITYRHLAGPLPDMPNPTLAY